MKKTTALALIGAGVLGSGAVWSGFDLHGLFHRHGLPHLGSVFDPRGHPPGHGFHDSVFPGHPGITIVPDDREVESERLLDERIQRLGRLLRARRLAPEE